MTTARSVQRFLNYSGRCATCGVELPKGARGWHLKHAKRGRSVQCCSCGQHGQRDIDYAQRKIENKARKRAAQASNTPAPSLGSGSGSPIKITNRGTPPAPHTVARGELSYTPKGRASVEPSAVLWEWDSVADLVADLTATSEAANPNNTHELKRVWAQRKEWSSGVGIGNLRERLTDPPAHQIGNLAGLRRELLDGLPMPVGKGRRLERGHKRGHRINARKLLAGSPRPWARRVQTNDRMRPVVRLCVNSGVLGAQKSEELFWRGAAAAALCEALEREGWPVELSACACATGILEPHSTVVAQHVTIKRASERVPMSLVCFILADVGFHRTAQIGIRYTWSPSADCCGGRTALMPDGIRERYDVVFDSDIVTREDAVNHVRQAVRSVRNLASAMA